MSLTLLHDWTIIILPCLTLFFRFCIFLLFQIKLLFWTWQKSRRLKFLFLCFCFYKQEVGGEYGRESVLGRLLGKSCSVTFLLNHSFLFCLKIVEYIFFDKGLYGRQSKCQPQLTVSLEEGDRVSWKTASQAGIPRKHSSFPQPVITVLDHFSYLHYHLLIL